MTSSLNTFYINYKNLLLVFLLFIFSCSEKIEGQIENKDSKEISTPVVAYAKVDKVKGTIGDTITYELNIDQDKEIKVTKPDIKKNLEEFEITQEEILPDNLKDNRIEKKFIYKFQVKNLGSYSIKPVEIKYKIPQNLIKKYGKDGLVKTSKIYLEIIPTLNKNDKNKDIEDIKDIEEINVVDTKTVILIFIGLFIFVYLIYLFFKKIFKPKPPLLPHELAFNELNKLKKLNLDSNKEIKSFYFEISETIRKYLKNRFEVDALEKNFSEIEKDLISNKDLNDNNINFLRDFIDKTDFYKFTDYVSNKDSAIKILTDSFIFIDNTKKIPEKEKKNK
ncbi:MAG: hypothetical protein U0457_20360 [Candidatus Sericytochromatia bacterium]